MTCGEPAPTTTGRVRRILVAGALVVAAIAAACGGEELVSSSSGITWPSLDEADGAVPDGTTVFDDEVPGVANLDPGLLAALREAAREAASDGVELRVNSGWRSAAYQDHLLRQAVADHGSEEEASRWVATAETSEHVSGDAVDIGPSEAAAWLAEHGAEHGLCRVYDNEPWHVELRPDAVDQGCPSTYADPTEDPRMQR